MHVLLMLARLLLAAVFVVSGLAKLVSVARTRESATSFGLPPRLAAIVAPALPVAELGLAALLVGDVSSPAGAWSAVALTAGFTGLVAAAVARGRSVSCNCFGGLSDQTVTGRTLLRNVVLLTFASSVAVATSRETRPDGLPYGSFTAVEWTVTGLATALAVLTVVSAHVIALLLKQQGRLLLRVDALENGVAAQHHGHDHGATQQYGLAVGEVAPAFTLAGLHGETLTLDSLIAHGRPVLLQFSDPHCGPCSTVAPVVARWQRESADLLTTVLVTTGTAEDNRLKAAEHGLTTVLLDEGGSVAKAYSSPGTPSAVVIGVDGRILSETAAGPPDVQALGARFVGGEVSAPPTSAPGPGDPAPEFELTALDGTSMNQAYLVGGPPTVVLFWDPHCGFCQRMKPRLEHWDHQSLGGERRLIVVATGGAEAVADLELRAPVLLDTGSLMQSFGANGTPMAVLIDADGRIASPVAAGEEAVFDLLGMPAGDSSRSLPLVPGGNA